MIEIKYLSDLPDGASAVIAKVKGYGAFRKRITEMGFVAGTTVTAIKKAPLQDPVEYELMGYRVSLRRSEAAMVEVVSPEDAAAEEKNQDKKYLGTFFEAGPRQGVRARGKNISVALVGNPNSGKTTLFNRLTGRHEHVGNYGGVTVDLKTAGVNHQDYRFELTDLPGTYSVSEFTPEELFVRRHLTENYPDVVINVVDASNLERNLFLTTQLIDMNIRVVIALNMYDELDARGDRFDHEAFAKLTGIPVVPTVASKGKGIGPLLDKVIEVYEENSPDARHIHINYGTEINSSVNRIRARVKKNSAVSDAFHAQYVAIKLLEGDGAFTEQIAAFPQADVIVQTAAEEIARLEKMFGTKSETIIADAKYAFVRGALKETYKPAEKPCQPKGYSADKILTNKWLGIPLFLFFMWAMFQLTFTLSAYPMEWIEAGVGALGELIGGAMADGMVKDLLVDGVIGGVGGVIVFLPNIIILFFCISLMEDTGYMARAAFIMDKAMHRIGLHGRSFIPMLMGFGCGVPAIMATRTLDNKKDRILTMLIVPFMSCSARLPVYVLFISAFFARHQGLIMLSIYAIGVLIAVLSAMGLNKIFFKKADVSFVMELPPYRVPTLRNIGRHTWNKSVQYLTKMGTVILAASVIIWALGYFPRAAELPEARQMENSYIGRIGHAIEPALSPLGYDWKIGVSLITGLAAKEIVISSMGVLYQADPESDETSAGLQKKLREQTFTSGPHEGHRVFTPLVAYSFMIFILIYFPCIAALSAIRREAGWRWALFSAIYSTALAWVICFAVYQIGTLFP